MSQVGTAERSMLAALEVSRRPGTGSSWTRARVLAVVSWCSLTVSWAGAVGIPSDRAILWPWLVSGLAAFSVGRRQWYRAILDWSPFLAFYLAYENVRGLAFTLDSPTMWHLPIQFDRWVGGGTLPAVWLQQHLLPPDGRVAWWEAPLGLVYVSHYYAYLLVAAALWLRSRTLFKRFMAQIMVVLGVGLIVFIAVPSAPPWAAARCTATEVASRPSDHPCMDSEPAAGEQTLIPPFTPPHGVTSDHLQRRTGLGFKIVPGSDGLVGGVISFGFNLANPVAAVPSLHAACAMLISGFLWPLVRRRWRLLLAVYPVAMGLVLVWTADHYIFDVLAGWLVAAAVLAGGYLWLKRRDVGEQRRLSDRATDLVH